MPTPLKPTGRTVRDIASDIAMTAKEQKTALLSPLGSTDPVAYQKAMKAALALADDMHLMALEIERICVEDALRGSYKGGDE